MVYPYWTHINYDEEYWGEDLVDHVLYAKDSTNPEDIKMIGFGIECNSLEELEILEKYFKRIPEFSKVSREIYDPRGKKDRVWFTSSSESPFPGDGQYGALLISPMKFGDYDKLRGLLRDELWKMGFLMFHKNDLILG